MISSNKKIMLYLLVLVIFIEPQGFKSENSQFSEIDYIYKILKLIICFILLLIWLFSIIKYRQKKLKIDLFILFTFIFEMFMLVSTIVNKGDIVRFVGPSLTVISMSLISKMIIGDGLLLPVLKKLNVYFILCYFINIVSMLVSDFIVPGTYFLGIDNRFVWTFFPWVVTSGTISIMEKDRLDKKYVAVFFLTEIILLYKWSVGAMVAMALFMLPMFVSFKKIAANVLYAVNILVNVVITSVNLQNVVLLRYIVRDFLQKDMTFSGRTYLWSGVYNAIYSNPLLGNGTQSIVDEKNYFYTTGGSKNLKFLSVMHAHNSFMTILFRGGILSLASYLVIMYIVLKRLKDNIKHRLSSFYFVGFMVILLLSLFDTIDFSFLFFFFGLCYYIKSIKVFNYNA